MKHEYADRDIANILRGIKLLRPDLRSHGFGLKAIALEAPEIRELLYSCDSMAWSYPQRFKKKSPGNDNVHNRCQLAHNYQQGINDRIAGTYQRQVPATAGAGNGQGRKSEWKSKTQPLRIPKKYHPRVLALCKKWEEMESE